MNRFIRLFLLAPAILVFCSASLFAQSTLVLKNGRRITVQSYREEGGIIKFSGFGGEIGIAKDQIQAILKPGEDEGRGLNVPGGQASPSAPERATQEAAGTPGPSPGQTQVQAEKAGEAKDAAKEKALSPEEQAAQDKAKEEKEYQTRVKEITEQIKAMRERYVVIARGTGGSEPVVASTEEQIKARTDLLMSRQRDAEHNRAAQSDVVSSPPTGYSEKERAVTELRQRITQLEGERDRLIEEMRQKGFESAGLFVE